MFFGFTKCADVCPMTLSRLALMRRKIGADFDAIRVVFITLDPQRDNENVLHDYLASQPIPAIGLTGSLAAVSKAAVRFGVFSERVPSSDKDYTIDHTASVFLLDSEGVQVDEIATDESEANFEAKLRKLLPAGNT